jgi:ethanolamine utilization protein EutA
MDSEGGRIFFSNAGRSLEEEDEIRLVSVGIDIGSSTTHMAFSRIVLERMDNRYIVSERTVLHESDVLLTPYLSDTAIDATALAQFIDAEYERIGLSPDTIDTGALILTGVAVRRRNARAIADLFAAQAGKFVSVSAGDGLETMLAAFGSGAAARSIREGSRVMNLDIGGGTSKIAVCEDGQIVDMTAIDVGARVICLDQHGAVARMEEAGARFALEAGHPLTLGQTPAPGALEAIAECMAARLFETVQERELSAATASLLRLDAMRNVRMPDAVSFSGGVSEYIYEREARDFGDMGRVLARAILRRMRAWGPRIEPPDQGIRATVVGASQYTVQVSGGTIYVEPQHILPLRNIPVVAVTAALGTNVLDAEAISASVRSGLKRLDLLGDDQPVALCYRWEGSATYARIDAFCRGIVDGMARKLAAGLPIVLIGEGDIGGLIGIHCKSELGLQSPVVSVDGIALKEFDFIDIGELLPTSGAVPVVIKSLIFPATSALGMPAPSVEIA